MPFRALLLSGVLLSLPSIAAAAAAAAAPVKAANVDCNGMRDRLTGQIGSLRRDADAVTQACAMSISSPADQGITNDRGKGACKTTYETINYYAEKVTNDVNETCRIVDDAKALKTTCGESQARCLQLMSEKDKAVASRMRQIEKLLGDAQKEVKQRQKDVLLVAEQYRRTIQAIKKAVANAKTPEDLREDLMCIDTHQAFGADAISGNGWMAVNPADLMKVLNGYDEAFPAAFPDETGVAGHPEVAGTDTKSPAPTGPSTITSPTSGPTPAAPANPLGPYTSELKEANASALTAIKTMKGSVQSAQELATSYTQQGDALANSAKYMGSAEHDGNSTKPASTVTGDVQKVANGVSNAAGSAQQVVSAQSSVAGVGGTAASTSASSYSVQSTHSSTGSGAGAGGLSAGALSKNGLAENTDVAAADGGQALAATSAANGGTPGATAETTGKANKPETVNDLLGSFAPLGAVSVGEDPDIRAAQNAASGGKSTGASGTYVGSTMRASRAGSDSSGPSAEAPAASAPGEEPVNGAGGLHGGPKSRASAAPQDFNPYHSADGFSLRDMLRKRLEDRAKAGGDADASMAVEAVLSPSAPGGGRGLASVAEERGSEGSSANEQAAGPQAMDSEPLFRRVHNAHNRFQLRALPRHAEI